MKLKPRPHFVIAKLRYNMPQIDSELALNRVHIARDWLPHEMPARLVKRLIGFLRGTYPVPSEQLEVLIPRGEAAGARRAFQELLRRGLSPGDAIVELGILSKKEWSNVPQTCYAEVVQRGCACSPPAEGETGLVASSAGERISGATRILRCSEFLARTSAAPETAPPA